MSEAKKKGELALRDKAVLHQQRRLKQATQFSHKDSADLLPLDGLKRLGTSKDLQPHSIVQRRLMEGNFTRLRGDLWDPNARVRSPLADPKDGAADAEEKSESTAEDSEAEERESLEESEKSLRSDEEEEEEEEDDDSEAGAGRTAEKTEGSAPLTALLVQCKCRETEVKASINTGSQHNHISSSCCQRLGLVPGGGGGSVACLQLQLGGQTVQCSAHVTGRGLRAAPGPSDPAGTQMLPGPEHPGPEAARPRRGAALPQPFARQPVPTRHQREPVKMKKKKKKKKKLHF
uniref:Nuclear receptor interacting protein 2 n=1 Tax=Gasterosteus aculeatus aculeatus TaxID=481459 RepID=G3Q9C0_GASAC